MSTAEATPMSVRELSRKYGIRYETIFAWISRGLLPSVKVQRAGVSCYRPKTVVNEGDFIAFLAANPVSETRRRALQSA